MGQDLLLAGELDPVVVVNGSGKSPFFLVCEHAGRAIPKSLGNLGLEPAGLQSHIAWDIGAEAVSRALAARLDAPLVLQRYSRLVYDCNRPPESPDAMPEVSELTRIPGNEGLSAEARSARAAAIYHPFHAEVSRLLDLLIGRGPLPILVTVHSFTPVYKGIPRTFELGVLHDSDSRLADAVLRRCERERSFEARRNEPYGPADGVTHTLKLHGLARGLPNVMLEIRNDLIGGAEAQRAWAERLCPVLAEARGLLLTEAAAPASRAAAEKV